MSAPTYDLESVNALPDRERSWVPPLARRKAVRIGEQVRLLVIINGRTPEHPWVNVTIVDGCKYVGRSSDHYGGSKNGDEIPCGTVFEFGPEHIIEI